MRHAMNVLNHSVTRQQFDELDSVRIICALKTYVYVTGEHKWVDVKRKSIQNVWQFGKKCGGNGS